LTLTVPRESKGAPKSKKSEKIAEPSAKVEPPHHADPV
jgi:hypothetical protein